MAQEIKPSIDFCTLGMFIIDEIHFLPPTPPALKVPGGAGVYAALGARLFSPPPSSQSVGWVVDAGSDFPPELRERIQQWNTTCRFRETPNRRTTRGWCGYTSDQEKREFRYLTPKLVLDETALTQELLMSKSFHIICSPTRCKNLVSGILALRQKLNTHESSSIEAPRPLFVWEPVPDSCVPSELSNFYEALKFVDVVSPNHIELASFFQEDELAAQSELLDRALLERWSYELIKSGIGDDHQGSVIVRAGKYGCYLATGDLSLSKWLPAFHQTSRQATSIVDPTGAGNTFLGGLAIGLIRGEVRSGLHKLEEAAAWATVAASFAVEQVGLPMLGSDKTGETWNGVHVNDRLEEYKRRLFEETM